MDDLSAPDLSAPEGASEASPSSPDRVASLSARLSEALTAVGIAVRRREAEIELIDRTLAASSDAQSAAARQAAERMARVRAEHADELSLMQRARRALEDATTDAGELSYELDTHMEQSATAKREADELRQTVAGLRGEIVEQRSHVTESEAFVAALSDDLAEARRSLAAREQDLEQAQVAVATRERELEELREHLEIKTREAEELGRLMGAFTSGDLPADSAPARDARDEDDDSHAEPAVVQPPPATPPVEHLAAAVETMVDVSLESAADDDGDDPPAPPAAVEPRSEDADLDEQTMTPPRFAEAPDIDIPVPAVEDAMDEMAGFEAMPPPDDAGAEQEAANDAELSGAALVFERTVGDGDGASNDDDAEPPAELAAYDAAASDEASDDAVPDAPVDISVDDWGAVVEEAPPADATPEPAPASAAGAAVDGELQAYLSAMGDDEDVRAPDALFKATSDISAFQCASAEEVRLAGALQLQSWRPSELAQLIGLKEDVVRAKLALYHERGLVEVVRG